MKIAFIDTSLSGHHKSYIKTLLENREYDFLAILPYKDPNIKCHQVVYKTPITEKRTLYNYMVWMKELSKIISENNVDIVHFLYGDYFYKYFGFGLWLFSKYKIIATFHHMPEDALRLISVKSIFKRLTIGVVHTHYIKEFLLNEGITNVKHIEYPRFIDYHKYSSNASVLELVTSRYAPILLAIGETRENKGLDILLEALAKVNQPFHLLIAGKEVYYKRSFIEEKIRSYSENVTIILKFLSDDELAACFQTSDIIVLPYKKTFGGSSGPLVEGVWLRKTIIGPSHKSLGDIIKRNHLGYLFEPENSEELAKAITKALTHRHIWDDIAESYRQSLDTKIFIARYKDLYEN